MRQGLYRLNVVPEDATELIVRKGRVVLSDSHTDVKGGNKVVFSATAVSVAKLTKDEKKAIDKADVDVWSKKRAETLAKANSRITNRMLTYARSSYGGFGSFSHSSLGFWFYNGRIGCFTFVPYFVGLGSPYGSSYSVSLFPPYYNPYGWNGNNGTGYWPNNGSAGPSGRGGQQGSTSGGAPSSGGTSPMPSSEPSGGLGRQPRMTDPDTGARMPRKNIEVPTRPNNN